MQVPHEEVGEQLIDRQRPIDRCRHQGLGNLSFDDLLQVEDDSLADRLAEDVTDRLEERILLVVRDRRFAVSRLQRRQPRWRRSARNSSTRLGRT